MSRLLRILALALGFCIFTTGVAGAATGGDAAGGTVEQGSNGSATAVVGVSGEGLWERRSAGDGCVYEPAFVDGFPTQPVEPSMVVDGMLSVFYVARCPGSNVFYWQRMQTRSQLVAEVRARAVREVPRPAPMFYPVTVLSEYAFVRWPTYIWLDSVMRRSVVLTAATPQLSVSATVSARKITFAPPDHEPTVCGAMVNGPSQQFLDDHPPLDPFEKSPLVCEFRFTKSSFGQPDNKYRVPVTVDWSMTWTGSDGTAGVIDGITTTTVLDIAVAKIQVINTAP